MLLRRLTPLPFAFVMACAAMVPAAWADVSAVGRYKDWRVFTERVGKDLVCFAAVSPTDMAPKGATHGDVNFFVATWKSGKSVNQPSLKVGYELRSDLTGKAVVGRESFRLFFSGEEAFVSGNRDAALVAAVRKGTELRIEAVSARNTRTAYHFSLKGSSEAIDKARALCR